MKNSKILIRAVNWVGDAVMCLPALRLIRESFPSSHIAIVAKPWVADLYAGEHLADELIPYRARTIKEKIAFAWELRKYRFDTAVLLQNAFEAALLARIAGVRESIGYSRDGRGPLLTKPIAVPERGDIPPHQRFYYLELLRRAGIIANYPEDECIRLEGPLPHKTATIGVSPGAAYGSAKRWIPERFAEAASELAKARNASIALFGSPDERALCEEIAAMLKGVRVINYAGQTTLAQFIELAAACEVFLTNDSGAMHISSALGVPTVAIFGATDHLATGPTGPHSRVVREQVDCSPCLLRECPIDHRCMTAVSAGRVVEEALHLLQP